MRSAQLFTVATHVRRARFVCLLVVAATQRVIAQASLQVVVISTAMPIMIVVLGIVGFLFVRLQQGYRPTSRDLKRVESLSHSPLYAHLGETLAGVQCIRAYGHASRFQRINERVLDKSTNAWFMGRLCDAVRGWDGAGWHGVLSRLMVVRMQWLGIRLALLGGSALSVLTTTVMLFRNLTEPSLAALGINYCLFLSQYLQWGIMMIVKFEVCLPCQHQCSMPRREPVRLTAVVAPVLQSQLTSVQRVLDYADREPEKYQRTAVVPPQDWPSVGRVQFQGVSMRYRPELPKVLDNLSFTAEGGTMVAIVGRTGAGKVCIWSMLRVSSRAPLRLTVRCSRLCSPR